MNNTIAITGTSGFVGNYLKNYFHEKGYTVIALQRKEEPDDTNVRYFDLENEESITSSLFNNVKVLIHCAFVKEPGKQGKDANVSGTKAMLTAARKAGVKNFIFFSTTSAHENNASSYGQSKLSVEKLFSGEHDLVLKCGLIIGTGGLFKQMLLHALNKKIVPVLDGGKQAVQFISIDSVAHAIHHVLETQIYGTFILAQPKPVGYKELFLIVEKHFKQKFFFVPIPFSFLNSILSVSEKLHIRLPVSKENLLGLKAMKAWDSSKDADSLQIPHEELEDLLKKYFSKH